MSVSGSHPQQPLNHSHQINHSHQTQSEVKEKDSKQQQKPTTAWSEDTSAILAQPILKSLGTIAAKRQRPQPSISTLLGEAILRTVAKVVAVVTHLVIFGFINLKGETKAKVAPKATPQRRPLEAASKRNAAAASATSRTSPKANVSNDPMVIDYSMITDMVKRWKEGKKEEVYQDLMNMQNKADLPFMENLITALNDEQSLEFAKFLVDKQDSKDGDTFFRKNYPDSRFVTAYLNYYMGMEVETLLHDLSLSGIDKAQEVEGYIVQGLLDEINSDEYSKNCREFFRYIFDKTGNCTYSISTLMLRLVIPKLTQPTTNNSLMRNKNFTAEQMKLLIEFGKTIQRSSVQMDPRNPESRPMINLAVSLTSLNQQEKSGQLLVLEKMIDDKRASVQQQEEERKRKTEASAAETKANAEVAAETSEDPIVKTYNIHAFNMNDLLRKFKEKDFNTLNDQELFRFQNSKRILIDFVNGMDVTRKKFLNENSEKILALLKNIYEFNAKIGLDEDKNLNNLISKYEEISKSKTLADTQPSDQAAETKADAEATPIMTPKPQVTSTAASATTAVETTAAAAAAETKAFAEAVSAAPTATTSQKIISNFIPGFFGIEFDINNFIDSVKDRKYDDLLQESKKDFIDFKENLFQLLNDSVVNAAIKQGFSAVSGSTERVRSDKVLTLLKKVAQYHHNNKIKDDKFKELAKEIELASGEQILLKEEASSPETKAEAEAPATPKQQNLSAQGEVKRTEETKAAAAGNVKGTSKEIAKKKFDERLNYLQNSIDLILNSTTENKKTAELSERLLQQIVGLKNDLIKLVDDSLKKEDNFAVVRAERVFYIIDKIKRFNDRHGISNEELNELRARLDQKYFWMPQNDTTESEQKVESSKLATTITLPSEVIEFIKEKIDATTKKEDARKLYDVFQKEHSRLITSGVLKDVSLRDFLIASLSSLDAIEKMWVREVINMIPAPGVSAAAATAETKESAAGIVTSLTTERQEEIIKNIANNALNWEELKKYLEDEWSKGVEAGDLRKLMEKTIERLPTQEKAISNLEEAITMIIYPLAIRKR